MKIKLSYAEFFGNRSESHQFDSILHKCVKNRDALKLILSKDDVEISTTSSSPDGLKIIQVRGFRRTILAHLDIVSFGAAVLLPFVVGMTEITISHKNIFTYGRGDRSIADFFMRNYFYAASRGETVRFSPYSNAAEAEIVRRYKEVSQRYLWIIKSLIKEEIFTSPDVKELILANSNLPLFKFSSPMLERGAADFRQETGDAVMKIPEDLLREKFHASRTKMMSKFSV